MKTTTPLKTLSKTHYKLVSLAGLGGLLEVLDFTIYALFARYISQNFFPQEEALSALLNTFAIFAVGYFARPLGGIIFGHYGDKYGRKNTFVTSALLMAVATLFIGCLPTYQQIGALAPFLLLLLRLLQGISVGGEIPGATVFISEHFPADRRGFAVGLIFMGVTLGNVVGGSLGFVLTRHLSHDAMLQWGWRVPFIAGFFLGLVAFILRKKATETPIFKKMLQDDAAHQTPALTVLKTACKQLLIGIALTAMPAVASCSLLFIPSYPPIASHFKAEDLYLMSIVSFTSLAIFTGIAGWLSDYVTRKKLIIIGTVATIFFGYFLFTHLFTQSHAQLLVNCIILTALVGIVNGSYACTIAELFTANIRYSGMGICYNIGFALFGGLTPVVMTALLNYTQNPMALYYLLIASSSIVLVAASMISVRHIH